MIPTVDYKFSNYYKDGVLIGNDSVETPESDSWNEMLYVVTIDDKEVLVETVLVFDWKENPQTVVTQTSQFMTENPSTTLYEFDHDGDCLMYVVEREDPNTATTNVALTKIERRMLSDIIGGTIESIDGLRAINEWELLLTKILPD